MIRTLLAASAFAALTASAAFAQGETLATEPEIYTENNDDSSDRLPTAGTADLGGLLSNSDGSSGSGTTDNINDDVPDITEENNDDVSRRVLPQ